MTADQKLPNYCFIDGANLYLGTQQAETPWKFHMRRFRKYLREEYQVGTAFYFAGLEQREHEGLYRQLRGAGYKVVFTSKYTDSKGNADMDIVLEIMKKLNDESDQFEQVVLVTGDGDFKPVVDYLVEKERLAKVLFPNEKPSTLYRSLQPDQYENLSDDSIRSGIAFVEYGADYAGLNMHTFRLGPIAVTAKLPPKVAKFVRRIKKNL